MSEEMREVYAEVFVYGVSVEEYGENVERFLEYQNLMLNKTCGRMIKLMIRNKMPVDRGEVVNTAIGVEWIDELNCVILVVIPMETIRMMVDIVREKIEKKESTVMELPVPIRTQVRKEPEDLLHAELVMKAMQFRLEKHLEDQKKKMEKGVWN